MGFADIVDNIIRTLNPKAALKRDMARLASTNLRKYDGATTGRRTDGWLTRSTSANTEIRRDLVKLRDRHRDLVRNNPWANRAVDAIASNTVGAGIIGDLRSENPALVEAWRAWSETTQCDADNSTNLYGMQAAIIRAVAESGEVLIRRRVRRLADGFAVPLQLQIIEPDLLDITKNEPTRVGGRIINGVEFSAVGRITAYWMFPNHPGEAVSIAASRPIPASEIAHVYRVERPGQVRGVPWGASAMITLRDLDDYEDSYLYRNKIANCIVGAITDTNNDLPAGANAEGEIELPEKFEPGRWEIMPAGKDVKFNTPPSTDAYGPYVSQLLYRAAAAYGISFQALTGILTDVNFSSGRMGWLQEQRNVDRWRSHMIKPQALDVIHRWFFEAAELQGLSTRNSSMVWTPPQREMLDPVKETTGMIMKVRAGLCSLQDSQRRLGQNPDDVIGEIAEMNKQLDKLGIVLDTDPRHVTRSGVFQDKQEDSDG